MADARVRGRFVWHELVTTDAKAAETFFSKVFGWTAQPFAGGNGYLLFQQGKTTVAGLWQMADAKASFWQSYIGTLDVDGTVAKAVSLGARVLKSAEDLPSGAGRFAVLSDPQGVTFGVYRPPDAQTFGPPALGDYSWHELATPDAEAALTFYKTLFGWSDAGSMDMGPGVGTYYMFGLHDMPMGGVYRKPVEMQGPPAWLPYTLVADVRKTVRTIKSAGGLIISGPMEVPGGDWVANAVDSKGIAFAVHARAVAKQTLSPDALAKERPAAAKTPAAAKPTAKKSAATTAVVKTAAKAVSALVKKAAKKATALGTRAKSAMVGRSLKPSAAKKGTAKKTTTKKVAPNKVAAKKATPKKVRAGQKK